MTTLSNRKANKHWPSYARTHASVTPFVQHEVYENIASLVSGDVLDIGCGTGNLSSYVKSIESLLSYTAIDLSKEMIAVAKDLVASLGKSNFSVTCEDFMLYQGRQFDCAVAHMSLYALPSPELGLSHTYTQLKPGGKCVLTNPNKNLDIHSLLELSSRELIGHPDFDEFCRQNLSIAESYKSRFTTMDSLVRRCLQAGFELEYCHQQFYQGGLNFVVLRKPWRTLIS